MHPSDNIPPEDWPPAADETPDNAPDTTSGNRDEMTFLDHLEELRWTIAKSVIAFGLACMLVTFFLSQFSELLRWPYAFAISGRDLEMSGLINTSILGVFSVIFYLLIGGGLALSLPFILYFIAQFVMPGLNDRELHMVRPACLAAFLLFLLGAGFSFFILVPAALRASIIFNEMLGFSPLWTAASYYGLLTWMVLGVGTAFQFPLVLLILVFLELLSRAQLVAFRKYSIVLFLCLSAIVTPTTDPVTFILLALPMSLLYELAILGAGRIERKRRHQAGTDASTGTGLDEDPSSR